MYKIPCYNDIDLNDIYNDSKIQCGTNCKLI